MSAPWHWDGEDGKWLEAAEGSPEVMGERAELCFRARSSGVQILGKAVQHISKWTSEKASLKVL